MSGQPLDYRFICDNIMFDKPRRINYFTKLLLNQYVKLPCKRLVYAKKESIDFQKTILEPNDFTSINELLLADSLAFLEAVFVNSEEYIVFIHKSPKMIKKELTSLREEKSELIIDRNQTIFGSPSFLQAVADLKGLDSIIEFYEMNQNDSFLMIGKATPY